MCVRKCATSIEIIDISGWGDGRRVKEGEEGRGERKGKGWGRNGEGGREGGREALIGVREGDE